MGPRKKILIDTDIGDDIDDAFAILAAMALDFEIVGITTVFRNTKDRARMTKKLLKLFGGRYANVPVYAGYSSYADSQEENLQHMGSFSEELHRDDYAPDSSDPKDAIDFIINSCRRYRKELTVIALGPFCNIAKAIEQDPAALGLAEKVVIMGGAYYKQYADWNVMCDVPAADLMFRSLGNLECVGADVTHLLASDHLLEEVVSEDSKRSPALDYIRSLYLQWHAQYPENKIVLHDVLVIYYALDSTICTMESIRAAVITHGYAKGFTLNVDAYSKASLNAAYTSFDLTHRVLAARHVDLDKFARLVRQNISRCVPDSLPE